MKFTLMNKNTEVISFETYKTERGVIRSKLRRTHREDLIPAGYKGNMLKFIESRKAPRNRRYICSILMQLGAEDVEGFIKVTHAAALTDTFWVRDDENPKTWDQVSLYQNTFDENIARIAFEGGIGLAAATTPDLTVGGNYPKTWIRDKKDGELYLLKRGSETYGREVFAEYYASQVAEAICTKSVNYDLTLHHGHLSTKCKSFTNEQTGFSQMMYHVDNPYSVTPDEALDVIEQHDDGDNFRRMMVLDALTLNVDRHLGNFGLLLDNDTQKSSGMAPEFDNNRSMLFNFDDEKFAAADMDRLLDLYPRFDGEFNVIANDMLTDSIKADLRNFSGFRFKRHKDFNWSEERLTKFEEFMDRQIDRILKRTKLFPG